MLNRDEIKRRGIIVSAIPANYDRAASYDIRIGKILAIKPEGRSEPIETDSYWVPAQGMVEVISIETIKMPPDVAGYASVKTGLSRQGLLALNTGILDPGYEGPLSATIVNFGKADSLLSHGDTFLRLTFHEYDRPAEVEDVKEAPEEFLRKRKIEVAQNFSALFLNLNRHIEESVGSAFWRNLPIIGFVLALVSLSVTLTTWGVSYEQTLFPPKNQYSAESEFYFRDEEYDSYKNRLAELEQRVHNLETKAASAAPRQSLPQTHNQSAPQR